MGDRTYLSIGDVLALLREEFPDITISKIRFLESRGLLVPERTPSGYRKFYDHDVERLRWILRQQRENFLPLKVIKGRLEGQAPPSEPEALFEVAHVEIGDPPAAGRDEEVEEHADAVPVPVLTGAVRLGSDLSETGAGEAGLAEIGPAEIGLPDTARGANGAGPAPDYQPVMATTPAATSRVPRVPAEGLGGPVVPRGTITGSGGTTAALSAAGGTGSTGASGRAGSPPTPPPTSSVTAGAPAPPPAAPAPGDLGRQFPAARSEPAAILGSNPSAPSAAPSSAATPVPTQSSTGAPQPGGSQPGGSQPGGSQPGGSQPGAVPPASERLGTSGEDANSVAKETAGKSPTEATPVASAPAASTASALAGASLTVAELAQASGLTTAEVEELESYGLIGSRLEAGVSCFDEDALVMAGVAAGFAKFGIEARHLRIYKHAAELQASLYSQVVMPLLRQRNPAARRRAHDDLTKLTELGASLQACFAKAALKDLTGG